MLGWSTGLNATSTPTDLVNYWIDQLATVASDGNPVIINVEGATTATINEVYITEDATDLRQLLQKFLSMAVSFSQGTADYFQTDFSNPELLDPAEGEVYSDSEHDWDEAFGYFGAARNYNEMTDESIASPGYDDFNGDNLIDIRSELNLGHSVNCAKRDLGATNPATDLTKEAFDPFLAGRILLRAASASGSMTDQEKAELEGYITDASVAWEKCVAATVLSLIHI